LDARSLTGSNRTQDEHGGRHRRQDNALSASLVDVRNPDTEMEGAHVPSTLTVWTPDRIAGAPDPAVAFAGYLQQTMGIPWPTVKDLVILRKECQQIFDHYPQANWFTMCRIAEHLCRRKQRFERVWRVPQEFRVVWADGAIPELDASNCIDPRLERRVEYALERETDPTWRRRLLLTTGDERINAVHEWERERG
jgi:hypothetical protein